MKPVGPSQLNRQRVTEPDGPIRGLLIVALVAVLAAFGLGYRFGAGSGTAVPTTVASSASRPPSGTPAPAIQPDAVSDALRQAYLLSAGGAAICALDGPPACTALGDFYRHVTDGASVPVGAAVSRTEWTALGPVTVVGSRLALVADLGASSIDAAIAGLDANLHVAWTRNLRPVDPARQGIQYLDLGTLDQAQYLIAIAVLEVDLSTADGYRWRTYRQALAVASPGS